MTDRANHNAGMPIVAIITPYFNTGLIFQATAEAVQMQTLADWQWIIVNDGSTDADALAVLQPFRESSDRRIRVIDQPNRGLPSARNAGVAASTAPLLFFLDSDDLISPTALEKLAALLQSDPTAAFATAWSTVFGAESLHWRHGFESRATFPYENMTTPLVMMRRSVFEQVGGFDPLRVGGLEDYDLWLRCAEHGYWGRDIREFLVHQRRKHPQEYRGYAWPTRDIPNQFAQFQQDMRQRYPTVFRAGVPHLPALSASGRVPPIHVSAYEPRIGTTIYWSLTNITANSVEPLFSIADRVTEAGLDLCLLTPTPTDAEIILQLEPIIKLYALPHFLPSQYVTSFLAELLDRHPPYAIVIQRDVANFRIAELINSPTTPDLTHYDALYRAIAASFTAQSSRSARVVANQYALERLGLHAFRLTQALRQVRYRLVMHSIWFLFGPLWRYLKRSL